MNRQRIAQQLYRSVYGLLMLLMLSSCGFKLSGYNQPLALSDKTFAVSSLPQLNAIKQQVIEAYQRHDRRLVLASEADVLIELTEQSLTRRAITRNALGRATEFDVKLTVTFAVTQVQGDEQATVEILTVAAQQAYYYDNQQLLAAEHREREIVAELRRKVAEQLVYAVEDRLQ
ncbi:MAG: hypothetical protein HWE13_10425 [Gammaproteobacteria bacterium]|nr:hypothetical protein [Gammaproteobacteria bacterium]